MTTKNIKYVFMITFTTDRELTPEEVSELANACAVQIEDPHTWEDGQSVRASFSVRGGTVSAGVARRGIWRVLSWGGA